MRSKTVITLQLGVWVLILFSCNLADDGYREFKASISSTAMREDRALFEARLDEFSLSRMRSENRKLAVLATAAFLQFVSLWIVVRPEKILQKAKRNGA